jgi:hypothetical protein
MKYELGVYIPEDDILRSHRRENLKSYALQMFLGSVIWDAKKRAIHSLPF